MNEIIKQKALDHAQKVWGIYFDGIDEDCNQSRGEISQQDYIAGYEQCIDDTNYLKILESLKEIVSDFSEEELSHYIPSFVMKINQARQLIKEQTEIK